MLFLFSLVLLAKSMYSTITPDKFTVQSVSMFRKLNMEWFGMVCPCVKAGRAVAQVLHCIFNTHDNKAELQFEHFGGKIYCHCLMTENCQTAPCISCLNHPCTY